MTTRLTDLEAVRVTLIERMADCASDQNYAVMGRLLTDILKQIEELGGGEQVAGKATGLSDFEKRLRSREQHAATAHRAKG